MSRVSASPILIHASIYRYVVRLVAEKRPLVVVLASVILFSQLIYKE